MKHAIVAAALLLVGSAAASPGHTVPEETFLHVHWMSDGVAMHPSTPESWTLPPAWQNPCEPSTIRVPFTQVDPDGGIRDVPQLAREVDTAAAPARLVWYVEQVDPDGEPLNLPWSELIVDARLESGADVVASGSVQGTPAAIESERNVGRIDIDLSWKHDGTLPKDALALVVETSIDAACEGLPQLRPYGDADNMPVLRFGVYGPIVIDRIDPILGDDVRFIVHVSSPWGREDIVSLEPTATISTGQAPLSLVAAASETGLAQGYVIDALVNGTVRVDVIATNLAGASDERSLVFQVGSPEPQPPVIAEPTVENEDAPLPLVWAILGLVLAARRR